MAYFTVEKVKLRKATSVTVFNHRQREMRPSTSLSEVASWEDRLKFRTAYGASLAQLLAKQIDRDRSGHGAVTSQEEQPLTDFFNEIALSAT